MNEEEAWAEFFAPFDELVATLRRLGRQAEAEALEQVLHHTAYTTSSEMYGAFGEAVLDAWNRLGRGERKQVRAAALRCLASVRRVWPLYTPDLLGR